MVVIREKSKEIMNALAIDVDVFLHVPHGPHQASSCNPCFRSVLVNTNCP